MDGAPKSKRLFPNHTMAELIEAVKDPTLSNDRRDLLSRAINQRDPGSNDYIPPFTVPQL